MASRVANGEKTIGAMGGKLLGYYAVADGDWDYLSLLEFPDSVPNGDIVRAGLTLTASGGFEQVRQYRLATAAEVDGGSKTAEQTYRAPGQR